MAAQGRRWCFTVNNYTEEDCDGFKKLAVKSIIVGKEVGEDGTPHLQGFIKFNTTKRFAAVKKINSKAHWECAKGNDKQNLEYCSKQEVFYEFGHFDSGAKGGCSTLKRALTLCDKEFHELTEDEEPCYLKNEKFIVRKKYLVAKRKFHLWKLKELESAVLKPWQQKCVEWVEGPISDRKIRWYVDKRGGHGKSWMSMYLRCKHKAVVFANAKNADVAYAYNDEPVVIFDLTREMEGYFNYSIIEQLKNGWLWSPKYESCSKEFKVPHVIVFSNFEPEREKLTKDRWDIIHFKEIKKAM